MHIVALLLFLLPGPAPATLHKCLGADGVASYQSLPCPAGQRTAWTRRGAPAARPPAPPPVAAEPPPRSRSVAARAPSARPPDDSAARRCVQARRAADITRDRLWNRLSFRERSDLDASVRRACGKR